MNETIKLFEKETKLKVRFNYTDNEYYECTGKSYKHICNKIKEFNGKYKTCISSYDNPIKDVTMIVFTSKGVCI